MPLPYSRNLATLALYDTATQSGEFYTTINTFPTFDKEVRTLLL
jgi:hypothetical protein